MQAALLPDRGVVKVAGDDARRLPQRARHQRHRQGRRPASARFAALLTPQGKIIVDFIVAEAEPEDGGGFFLDCPRALAPALVEKLNFYKLRAKVTVEDLSEALGVMAVWDGARLSEYRAVLCRPAPAGARHAHHPAAAIWRPRPPPISARRSADAEAYDAHRIALGVPRGGEDFIYGDTFPHEADMDQLGGVDFEKGCYVGQEVVSRVEHRGSARSRIVPIAYETSRLRPACR